MDVLTATLLWEIFKNVRSWLANLKRAGNTRKQQSIQALRGVITAARETAVYLRHIKESGKPNHQTEAHLAVLWTELGFALQDIGINKLAKRCQIKGRLWSNPKQYDKDFIAKADVSLERMEQMARQILNQVKQ